MKLSVSKIYLFVLFAALALLAACADNDTFSTSSANRLSFSNDTVSLDTIFSKVPSSTRTVWVYNKSNDGLRCTSIKLNNGNQTGFRVNVNGVYLGESQGYQIFDEEIRKNDSIRVFVEATLPLNLQDKPQLVTDHLIFTLESGVQQLIKLSAWSWDAELLRDITVSKDSTLTSDKPIVIYGSITVKEGATLTIPAGQIVYLHNKAVIDVHGTLKCLGEPGNEVVLRSDRLDNMFDYLKYDEVSGQWGGIHFAESSYDNVIENTDIHATESAIVCDSADVTRKKLTVNACTIHNAKGFGIMARNCMIDIINTQISNTLGDCICVVGGNTDINGCTIAQFYPFDGNRGDALNINEDSTLVNRVKFHISNSIVTGYAEDVVMVNNSKPEEMKMDLMFDHCLMRTPEVKDEEMCKNVIWEDVKDTICAGWKNFEKVDTKELKYDFRLKEKSLAIGAADPLTSLPTDRDATKRDDTPDMGCYEFKSKED